jgi:putative membrane protein
VAETPTSVRRSRGLLPLDAARGFAIGTAELVPGVSGGTVALVTGVYEQLIDAASHVLGAGRTLLLGPDRVAGFRGRLAQVDWWLIVPVFVGMFAALFTIAGTMSSFVTDQPEHARGLFFGLVAASLVVPLRMLGGRPGSGAAWVREAALVVGAAVVAFVLVGMAGGGNVTEPPLWVVFLAATVAICALVVPGVSGSFFLLAIGLYATTLDAIDGRDFTYLTVFAAGAAVGLGSFVQVLRWLLHHRRRVTLLVMTGLMIGSLRALWPWQADGGEKGPGELMAPYDPVGGPVLLAVAGAVTVTGAVDSGARSV